MESNPLNVGCWLTLRITPDYKDIIQLIAKLVNDHIGRKYVKGRFRQLDFA